MEQHEFDITHLADLARLRLTEAEATDFQAQIESILGYVDQLRTIDVAGVEETAQVTGLTNVLRADTLPATPLESRRGRRAALLAATPVVRDHFIEVPSVLPTD